MILRSCLCDCEVWWCGCGCGCGASQPSTNCFFFGGVGAHGWGHKMDRAGNKARAAHYHVANGAVLDPTLSLGLHEHLFNARRLRRVGGTWWLPTVSPMLGGERRMKFGIFTSFTSGCEFASHSNKGPVPKIQGTVWTGSHSPPKIDRLDTLTPPHFHIHTTDRRSPAGRSFPFLEAVGCDFGVVWWEEGGRPWSREVKQEGPVCGAAIGPTSAKGSREGNG